MTTVFIRTESHYTVNRDRIRDKIDEVLKKRGVKGRIEVSVAIVGDRQMRMLNNKYRKLDQTTDVLAFPLSDTSAQTRFVDSPDGVLRLGDIVISYPQARDDASEEEKLVDEKIDELIEHAMSHLLGYNHD